MTNTVHIETPSRLHFGLIDLTGSHGRIDGSVGLALEKPGFTLTARASSETVVSGAGPFRDRVAALLARLRREWGVGGVALAFEETIPPHSGLGSGTQVSLAAIHALAGVYGVPLTPERAAALSERGGTSGIGVYAFYRGGFLVDGGHRFPEEKADYLPSAASPTVRVGPLLWRHDFPDWELLLVIPNARHVSGQEEARLFRTLCPIPASTAGEICHALVMGILPALAERDLPAFARAIERMQVVGWKRVEIDAQKPVIRKTAEFLRSQGAYGVGMSSWGPTLVAFAEDAHALRKRADAFLATLPEGGITIVTRANNTGARIEIDGPA